MDSQNLNIELNVVDNLDTDEAGNESQYDLEDTVGSVSTSSTRGTHNRKRARRSVSKVWTFFKLLPQKEGEKQVCECKHCGKTYIAEGYGTSNLKRHLKTCQKTTIKNVGGSVLPQLEYGSSRFDQEKFRELVVTAIIKHELPFSFVEYDAIRAVFTYLNDEAVNICRNTAKADVLKLYQKEKERLKKFLVSIPGRVNLTSDLWTSISTDGYISLTAHFIDDDWNLQKRLLNFSLMLPPHTGVAICEKIYNLLLDWKIENKLFSITLDNASANTVFVDLLRNQLNLKQALIGGGELFHVRCCAHVLNLIVNDGLKLIDDSVGKIRESIKYLRGSQVRKQKFLECVSYVSLGSKKGLRQDVPTRWNSTFLMLESALYYERAFIHLKYTDSNYVHCPTLEEWKKVKKISDFLGIFYNATSIFSGTKYPTSNLFFPKVFVVQHTLKMGVEDSDVFIKSMAEEMEKKFDKYWNEYSLLLAIACVLDPRYKIQFVEFCYTKLYGSVSREFNNVKTKLFSIYDEYASKAKKDASPSTSVPSELDAQVFGFSSPYSRRGMDVLKEFDSFECLEFADIHKSQLELYLGERRLPRDEDLDILSFWKTNQYRYPILAIMARDVLSVPVSTVASESAFSGGGRVLDQYRSSLKPENVEALVCTRDWLYGNGINDVKVVLEELTEDVMKHNIGEGSSM